MSDRDIVDLLRGVDGPRPLPESVRADVEARLTMGSADAPRALPDDLRQRLESSLLERSLPPRVERRLTAALARPANRVLQLAAAVAAVVLLLGIVVAGTRDASDDAPVASPPPSSSTSATSGQSSGAATGSGSAAAVQPPPFTEPAAPVGVSGGSTGANSAPDAAPAAGAAATGGGEQTVRIRVIGGGTDVAAGFDAYLEVVNDAGGVGGRRVEASPEGTGGAVATVNLSAAPVDHGDGVLFETVHVWAGRVGAEVVSLSSPIEAQAQLAVAGAFPQPAPGATASIYTAAEPVWFDHAAPAFEEALRQRGVTVIRVPFDPVAPRLVAADAAFLALPPMAVEAWLGAAVGEAAPPFGTWGVASAWDDAFAAAGAAAALHVLSPYATAAADEADALRSRVGTLSSGAVHGWVTAKAIARLLFEHGGAPITEPMLDGLGGWASGWSPPFETRAGTRARTPEAVHLVPDGDVFRADGDFQRA